jgi:predicted amidophosphoribosyltransferase
MNCPNSRNEIPADSKFCNQCGTKIEVLGKSCPVCRRKDLPAEVLYCPDCGRALEKSTQGKRGLTKS